MRWDEGVHPLLPGVVHRHSARVLTTGSALKRTLREREKRRGVGGWRAWGVKGPVLVLVGFK